MDIKKIELTYHCENDDAVCTQLVSDIPESGTLVCPRCQQDMILDGEAVYLERNLKTLVGELAGALAGLVHAGAEDEAFAAIKNVFLSAGTYVTRWTAADVQAYGDITPEQAREIVTSDTFREVMENGELFDDIIGTVVFESGF